MKHSRFLAALAGMLLVGGWSPASADDAPRMFVLTAHFITVRAESSTSLQTLGEDGVERASRGSAEQTDNFQVLPGSREIQVGEHRLSIEGDYITWDSGTTMPPPEVMEVLSSPRITTLAGQMSRVRTGFSSPLLQYFERTEDGLYRLRTATHAESPGITLDVTVSPRPRDANLDVDIGFEVRLMRGRESVEGTTLDVGRPVLASRELDTRLVIPLGEWSLLTALLTQAREELQPRYLLVFLRLDRPPPSRS